MKSKVRGGFPVGQAFGELTVVGQADNIQTGCHKYGFAAATCRCSCGREVVKRLASLTSGRTGTCGECRDTPFVDYRGHHLYGRWTNMQSRCLTKSCKDFPAYGGRGITIWWHWSRQSGKEALKNYCDWVDNNLGQPPSESHQIDRIDNNRGYMPDNIRWATPSQNQFNKRKKK